MAASVIALVPLPVLGGAGIVLFGSVAASGIQTLATAALEKGENALIVAAAVGIGLIPIAAPEFYHSFPKDLLVVLDSGISTGCVVAIVLNLAFNHLGGKPEPEPRSGSRARGRGPGGRALSRTGPAGYGPVRHCGAYGSPRGCCRTRHSGVARVRQPMW